MPLEHGGYDLSPYLEVVREPHMRVFGDPHSFLTWTRVLNNVLTYHFRFCP